MSDTIYEKDRLYVTRFWGGEVGDCVQITVAPPKEYVQLTLAEFREMVAALEKNVEDTKDAWWHGGNHVDKKE